MNGKGKKSYAKLALFSFIVLVPVGLAFLSKDKLIDTFAVAEKKEVAVYRVEPREFVIKLPATGELKATNSVNIIAPSVQFPLEITRLAPEGSFVKKGDVLVEFEKRETQKAFVDAYAEYRKAVQEVAKKKAIIEAERKALEVDLIKAQFALEKAKVAAQVDESLVSKIELLRAKLDAEQAAAELEQIKKRIESREKEWAADLAIIEVAKDKAEGTMSLARRNLEAMTIRAPIDGIVIYAETWRGSGMGKVQVGDRVWPGFKIIELPDLSKMEVLAQVNEADAGMLRIGQEAVVRIDAYPGPEFTGKITKIASLAKKKEFNSPIKVIEATVSLDETVPAIMKPGLSAKVDIFAEQLGEVLSVPQEAVFEKNGRSIVYLMNGNKCSDKV